MGAIELMGVAASLSLLAGWRLYACVAAVGIAMRVGLLDLPDKIAALDVLANPWVIGVAAVGAIAELFADKVMWLDTLWDGVHTLIRPLGGALLALAVIDASDPAWQVAVFLLGGGAALLSHGAKAGARAAVNASPEPFSNMAVSTAEDVASLGGLWLVLTQPAAAVGVAVFLVVVVVVLLIASWRMLAALRRWMSPRA
ncbi:DUF4126 domain-containing protein [Phenylobacterium sp. LH3H17]|uniref:DUF4126 domain-containing protein n=1 Tax=Phenylobacterium sp. LH3H17 TaxID=2903901 RepID=UPI0020C943DD|nr:DUF4126 domain-containing protein [Phenylobacterium sp. LH3H17]UTP38149.1 DUF4126 domain-containing protein [Phenylobacterium sp. LH3H17]